MPCVLRNEPSQRVLSLSYADFGIDLRQAWGVEELVGALDGTFVAGEVAHDESHGFELAQGGAALAAWAVKFLLAALQGEERLLELVAAKLRADVALHHLVDKLVLFLGIGMVGGGDGLFDFFKWVGVVCFLGKQERGEPVLEGVAGAFEFAGGTTGSCRAAGVAAIGF